MTKQRLELTWYNKDMALIPTEAGKYGYTWVDPSDPRYCETRTLIKDDYVEGKQSAKSDEFEYSERADLPPQDDNLLIFGESGDVLEALTRVPELADKYLGKVKLIYIDPPFNTGEAFTNYEDNLEHSVWLTMMRDRLLHMRKLLSDDGSIWVHLDSTENHRMRLLMDEVFGANCFVAEVIWGKADTSRNDAKQFSTDHDTIYVYSKKENWRLNRLPRTTAQDSIYKSPDGDSTPWIAKPGHAPGAATHQGMVYAIQSPFTGELLYPPVGGCWRLGQESMHAGLNEWARYRCEVIDDDDKRAAICGIPVSNVRSGIPALLLDIELTEAKRQAENRLKKPWPNVFFINNGRRIQIKGYLPSGGTIPRTIWSFSDVGSNRNSKAEIKSLFHGVDPFSTPKPERLLERIIHIGSNPGDIVLDVFAGSGTTAAVAQKMGRRWVTCELREDTFNTFTRPRLEKVVNDHDPGGITRTKGERVPAAGVELPDGVSAEDAAKFTSVLNKLIADNPEAKKDSHIKALKAAAKTKRTKEVINWRGGGGFWVAHLSPSCFDYDSELGMVTLTEAATGDVLVQSVVANLGFHRLHPEDDYIFDGKRGRSLLKVYEGVASVELVDELLTHLVDDETLVIATTGVADGVREYLRKARRGSRLVHIPDDLFCVSGEEA